MLEKGPADFADHVADGCPGVDEVAGIILGYDDVKETRFLCNLDDVLFFRIVDGRTEKGLGLGL